MDNFVEQYSISDRGFKVSGFSSFEALRCGEPQRQSKLKEDPWPERSLNNEWNPKAFQLKIEA